jgi:hypothetical protein
MNLASMPTGMIVLLTIAFGVAAICHWRIRRFWRATVVTALVTPAIFFIASTIQGGLPDPLRPVALVYFAGFALLIAMLVGLAFSAVRRLLPVNA